MAESKRRYHPMPGLQMSVQRLKRLLDASSDFDHILIRGPRGVGKSYFVELYKEHYGLADADIVHLNCAAIYPDLADSELFGHMKGAFTGANENRSGFIKAAEKHRVMILEEFNSLPKVIQAKLLVFLETFTYYPVGSREKQEAKVRIIATANEEEETGIRTDLLDRFKLNINVPPLNWRRGDIFYFIAENYPDLTLKPLVLFTLYSYSWPGNLRELNRVLLEMKAKVRWGIPERVGYLGGVSDGFSRAFNKNFKYTNKILQDVRPPDNEFITNILKIRFSSETFFKVYDNPVLGSGKSNFNQDEPYDYKKPEIVVYTNKGQEVGSALASFVDKYFSDNYPSKSTYTNKFLHIADNPGNTPVHSDQITISAISDFLISEDGVFPEVLKDIMTKIGHGGQARLTKILGVPKNTISRWVKKGVLPS